MDALRRLICRSTDLHLVTGTIDRYSTDDILRLIDVSDAHDLLDLLTLSDFRHFLELALFRKSSVLYNPKRLTRAYDNEPRVGCARSPFLRHLARRRRGVYMVNYTPPTLTLRLPANWRDRYEGY